MTARPKN